MTEVAIYNLGGTQKLGMVSLRHAIGMLHRRVAQVLETAGGETFGPYAKPSAVELVRYVHTAWVYSRDRGKARPRPVPYSKFALLRRDRHKCGYCARAATTIDHVTPRCQGGQSTWLNTVAACRDCNARKAGRTPEQAGMRLITRPFHPTFEDIYPKRRR